MKTRSYLLLALFCQSYLCVADFTTPLPSPTPYILNREQLLEYLPKNGVVAEIGVQGGVFSQSILLQTQPNKLFLIDCWQYQDPNVYREGQDGGNKKQKEQDRLYKRVKLKFRKDPRVSIMKKFSDEAVQKFPDEYFDWVYIDANHSYEAISKDLEDWYPKIKKGGFIAGHDYVNVLDFGVIQAVNEFLDKHGLTLTMLTTQDYWLTWVIRKPE